MGGSPASTLELGPSCSEPELGDLISAEKSLEHLGASCGSALAAETPRTQAPTGTLDMGSLGAVVVQ